MRDRIEVGGGTGIGRSAANASAAAAADDTHPLFDYRLAIDLPVDGGYLAQ